METTKVKNELARRLLLLLAIGLLLIGGLFVYRYFYTAPIDDYRFKAPPVSAHPLPDPPNPDKIKRLSGMAKP